MTKIVCDKCNNINKVKKKNKFIFCNYCGKKLEVDKYLNHDKNTNSMKKVLLIILIILIIIIGIVAFLLPVRKINSTIKISEVTKYCVSRDECLLNKAIKKHLFSILKYKVEDIKFNGNVGKYEVIVKQFGKRKKIVFNLKDDVGPNIKTNELSFTTNGSLEFNQIEIVDFVDGNIDSTSEQVKINYENLDISKEGEYLITVEATDRDGFSSKKDITVKVVNAVPTSISLSIKDEYEVNERIELNATVYPENAYDKSLSWSSYNDGYTTFYDENYTSFSKAGIYSICAKSKANNYANQCTQVKIHAQCQKKYEFKYDGRKGDTLKVSEYGDICPGKYRVTAYQINDSTCPSIYFGSFSDIMSVCYNDASRSNGKLHVLAEGDDIEIGGGYTKVIFNKVS